jgi:RAS protein activator-like 2
MFLLATSLTRIAQSLSYSTPYLVDIIQAEISSTADNSLIFRGNSIATKSMEAYMKLTGETYLRETLTRFAVDIVSSTYFNDIDFEVDPDRILNIENLEKNQITLRLLCEQIWLEIRQSHFSFPQ